MKRVKTALLFNDKYKQGYSYIMPQYTSSATNRGVVVNTTLDTITNVQTITVTLPSGQSATTTVPGNTEGVPVSATRDIQNQFAAQGITTYDGPAVNRGISSTTTDVVNQSAVASRTSEATGNPPPAETQPIPVSTTSNPSPTPTTSTQTVQTQPNPNSDPNTNIGAEIQVPTSEILQEPPVTNDGDEFTGIDDQVERQRQLEDGSLEFAGIDEQIAANENTLQEPPVLSDEEVDTYIRQAGQDETITSPDSITENVFNPGATFNAGEENVFDPTGNQGAPRGLSTSLQDTRSKATQQDVANFQAKPDWRVRLSLAPGADYLYKVKPSSNAGILEPLAQTDGVIFPYTPAISVNY